MIGLNMQQPPMHKAATATFLAILGLVPVHGGFASAQVREWTDNTGSYKFQAELVRIENDAVILKSDVSGKEKKVPLQRLSDADQAWVKKYLANISIPPQPDSDVVTETTFAKSVAPAAPLGPRIVKRAPEIIQLDPSHFAATDAPPVPKPPPANGVTTGPNPTNPNPFPIQNTEPVKTENASEIPDVGDIDLKQLASLPAPFATSATTAASSQNMSAVRNALKEIGQLPPESANESLLNLLRKLSQADDRQCRVEALNVLSTVSPGTCLPFVLRATNDESMEVKRRAFKLLKELNDAGCVEPLAARFASSDRPQIVTILEKFAPQAETYIHKMVSHSNSEVRLDAVRLLGRIGTSASLVVLNEALNDENGIVRLQAKSAIKQIESRK